MAASRRPVAASAGPLILFVNDSEGGQTIFLTGRFTVAGGGGVAGFHSDVDSGV